MLAVAFHLCGPSAVAPFKARLRVHGEHFKQRAALLHESAAAAPDERGKFGHIGAAFAWDNAANLLNAELNRI